MKKALITGVTGQDGSYLAEFLLAKGYAVVGLVRRASTFNTTRIDHLISDRKVDFSWERADLSDASSIIKILQKHQPDEIYHLAAQSHVQVSFEIPEYTMEVGVLGTLRILEAMKFLNLRCKFYNAGSSEMFGASPAPQSEATLFKPQSPYAIAKVAAHQLVVLYRQAFGFAAYNGILFNHESPRRGETFVTRKVTRAVAEMCCGNQVTLELGNLESQRDWGFSGDYVQAMWKMLQDARPGDYVISTGKNISVRKFVELTFREAGIDIEWLGSGINEVAQVANINDSEHSDLNNLRKGDVVVSINEKYFRPAEVDDLLGDASKAKEAFDWEASTSLEELVSMMLASDIEQVKRRDYGIKNRGVIS